MRILGRERLAAAMKTHPDLRGPLAAWTAEAESAEWKSPAEVRERYPKASQVGGDRMVFRIKGNHYRLIARIRFASAPGTGIVIVKWIGTHADYDRIDAATVQPASPDFGV